MTDLASVITAIAALVAACGGIIAAVLAYRARKVTDQNRREIVAVGDQVYQLGERLDGPLSELITSIRKEGATAATAADAQGYSRGEQDQRNRQAPPE